jgi:hypothetical protein
MTVKIGKAKYPESLSHTLFVHTMPGTIARSRKAAIIRWRRFVERKFAAGYVFVVYKFV